MALDHSSDLQRSIAPNFDATGSEVSGKPRVLYEERKGQRTNSPPNRLCGRTSNMEIANTKEKIPQEVKSRPRGWVERPLKGCSPPNEVAGSSAD
jgi:hypothetical protein